jgi:hypothetical protein
MKPPPPPPDKPCACYVCRRGNRALFPVSSHYERPPSATDTFLVCAFCLEDWRAALSVTSPLEPIR